jgi:hypothetical protein
MAKSKSAARRRKARQAKRAEKLAMQGKGPTVKTRNKIVLAMILRNGAGSHGDEKKRRSKTACRKKVRED